MWTRKVELFATVLRRYLAERIAMFTSMIEQAGADEIRQQLQAMHVTVDA